MDKKESIYKVVSEIPAGKVSTYKAIAKLAGVGNPRLVGNFLHKNKDPKTIPCHRVVTTKGRLAANFAFGGLDGQTRKLEAENVSIVKGRVDLTKYFWNAAF